MEGRDKTSIFEQGSLLGSRYRLDELLAGGGMAEVWRAHDTILDRAVAVKLLHPHLAGDATVAERFRREAISAARLSHPHIVPTFDTGLDGDTAFIVMGLVHGATVRELLNEGPLQPRIAVAIARQVADALAYSHSKNIIHRDIKPGNVLVVEGTNRVMVADFGIAKAVETSNDPSLTMPGMTIATPDYAAPEQLKGEELDGRTDVFALGVMIHEMVCGHTGSSDLPTQLNRQGDPSSSISLCGDMPEALAPVVTKACSESPEDRFSTALQMREELASLERELFALESVSVSGEPRTSQHKAVQSAPISEMSNAATPLKSAQERKRPKTHGARQSRVALIVMVTLVIAAAAFGKFFGSLGNEDPAPTNNPGTAVAGITASSFDPQGDGTEHENTASNAVDGDANTVWTTETYNEQTFGTKSGVGIRLSLDQSQTLNSMSVDSGSQGWAAQIFVASGNPNSLEAWGNPVDTQSGLGSTATFDLHSAQGDSVLLWITNLGNDRRFTASEISIESRP